MIRLTLNELREASKWAERHAVEKHDGKIEFADISIRHVGDAGICSRMVVLCERCDRVRVTRDNYHEITDWESA